MGGDDAAIIAQFIAQTGVTFDIGWDDNQSYFQFPKIGQISPFPLDVVVDRDGTIVYLSREYDPVALLAAVEAAR